MEKVIVFVVVSALAFVIIKNFDFFMRLATTSLVIFLTIKYPIIVFQTAFISFVVICFISDLLIKN